MGREKLSFKIIIIHILLIITCLLIIFPTFWMVSTSFKHTNDMFSERIDLLPVNPTLENYISATTKYPIFTWFVNSVFISALIIIGQIFTSLLAAYGLARFNFPGRNLSFGLILGTLIVPFQVTMIPNYIVVSKMGWLNTPWAVIIPYLASGFATFFLRQHILTLPEELFDAATIDGANSWQTLIKLVTPLSKAPIFALLILLFINAWNMYFWPMLVLNQPAVQTIAIGLRQFLDAELGFAWGELSATATLASLPTMIIYIFAQRYIINMSITSGLK